MIGPERNIANRERRASPGRVDREGHDAMPIVPSLTGVQQTAFRQRRRCRPASRQAPRVGTSRNGSDGEPKVISCTAFTLRPP